MPTKINTKLEFPNVIDLKEYSLNEIIRKENLLNDTIIEDFKKKLENPDEDNLEDQIEGLTDEEKLEWKQDRQKFMWEVL